MRRLTEMGVRELAALGAGAEVDLCAAVPRPVFDGRSAPAVSAP